MPANPAAAVASAVAGKRAKQPALRRAVPAAPKSLPLENGGVVTASRPGSRTLTAQPMPGKFFPAAPGAGGGAPAGGVNFGPSEPVTRKAAPMGGDADLMKATTYPAQIKGDPSALTKVFEQLSKSPTFNAEVLQAPPSRGPAALPPAPAKPAWQQLRERGITGQGSAAANKAALAEAQASDPLMSASAQPDAGRSLPNPAIAAGATAFERPPAEVNAGGPPPGVPTPPGATWTADPSMADTGGGMFVGADGRPVDYNGQPVFAGGAQPPAGGAVPGTTPDALRGALDADMRGVTVGGTSPMDIATSGQRMTIPSSGGGFNLFGSQGVRDRLRSILGRRGVSPRPVTGGGLTAQPPRQPTPGSGFGRGQMAY